MKPFFRRLITKRLEQAVVRLVRANPALKVVAVGGSVGKTSTKLAIAAVLTQKYRVLVQAGNYNSELGLPLSLFELEVPARITDVMGWFRLLGAVERKLSQPYPYDVVVLELGTDHPGDIPNFMAYLRPDIGLVTAITPEHMASFGTLEAVAEEEFALLEGSRTAVIHINDPELAKRQKRLGIKAVRAYGESGHIHWADGDNLCLGADLGTIKIKPQVVGDHSRLALLAAASVGVQLNVSGIQIAHGLNAVTPVPGRMQPLVGKDGIKLIDDSYNSSPDAVGAALKTLKQIAKGRRLAVLGQMNELGDYSRTAHTAVGRAAADLDLLITIGHDATTILGPAAVAAGLAKAKWQHFDSPITAGNWLAGQAQRGDTILFKGSQNGVFAEEAIKPLLADPADAGKLVRQSQAWLDQKAQQFGVQSR